MKLFKNNKYFKENVILSHVFWDEGSPNPLFL